MLLRCLTITAISTCWMKAVLGFSSFVHPKILSLSSSSSTTSSTRFNNFIRRSNRFSNPLTRVPMFTSTTTTTTSLSSSTNDASTAPPPPPFVMPSSWSDLMQACEATPVGNALRNEVELRKQGKGSAHVQNKLRLFDSDQPPQITLYRDHAGWWYVLTHISHENKTIV